MPKSVSANNFNSETCNGYGNSEDYLKPVISRISESVSTDSFYSKSSGYPNSQLSSTDGVGHFNEFFL